ncbi:probable polygalacturonase At3g15720 [Vigna umbellata]|uniref:probable polygalacturonase At3g15720 n=1 Tax=Vigna umbellata TaxID=87088 RepID=UPI001F5EECD3|nr:probable polygalacturonase At3g15720 [Vigna umbellata]
MVCIVPYIQISIDSPGNSYNTDGIDIFASNHILIEDSTIRCGDDYIAINDGSSYINATQIACGPGHGISFTNTTNGARIKTAPGGSGYARHITFEDIRLMHVMNPIIIDQTYGSKISKLHPLRVDISVGRGGGGVSMVAWPLYAEQHVNREVMVGEMKVVVGVNQRVGDGFVSAEENRKVRKKNRKSWNIAGNAEEREEKKQIRQLELTLFM